MGLNLGSIGKKLHDYEGAIGDFFGGAAHAAGNAVQGAEQAVGNVIHNPVSTVTNVVPHLNIQSILGAGLQQGAKNFNTLDNSISNSQPVQQFAQAHPTVAKVGGFVNDQVVKPTVTSFGHAGQLAQDQNPYSGTATQQLGQFGQDALNVASIVPVGRGAELAVKGGSLLPKVVEGAKFGAKTGGAFGAGYGITGTAQQSNPTVGDYLKNAAIGGVTGGLLGGAAGAAAPTAAEGTKAVVKLAKNDPHLNSEGGFLGSNPKVTELNNKARELNKQRENLLADGKSENHPSVKANDQAYKAVVKLRSDINQRGSVPVDPFAGKYKYKNSSEGGGTQYFNELNDKNSFQDINGERHPFQSNAKITVGGVDGSNMTKTFNVSDVGSQKYFNNSLKRYGERGKILGISVDHSPALAERPAVKPNLASSIKPRVSLKPDPLAEALGLSKTPSISAPKTFEQLATSNAQALRNNVVRTGVEGMSPEAKAATASAISRKNAPKITSAQLPNVAPGDIAQARLNSRAAREAITARVQPAIDAANKLSPADHALLDATRTTPAAELATKAENPQAFLDAAQKAKDYNDFTHALGTNQGQLLGYRQNYGAPLLYNLEDQGTQDALQQYQATLRRTPGYAKSRTTPDYATGANLGLQRLNKNFAEDLAHDANNRASHISELTLANGLQQAFPGKVAVGEIPRGYTQLQVANGKAISVPNEIAAKINNRAKAPDVNNLALKGYDAANRGLKYLSLGGGTFHSVTTAESLAGQQVLSGNALLHPLENLRVVAGTLSRKVHDINMARLAKDVDHTGYSTLDKARIGGVTLTPQEILGDANVNILNKAGSKLNFIKNVHDMVFGRQIPEGKLLVFKQATKGLDPSIPADLKKIRGAASAVNNLGGINRAIEGLTPKQAQQTARFVLATDFTETKFRKLADALTKGGPQGNIARQMIIGKVIVAALPGLAVAAAAGKLNSAEDWAKETAKQVLDPQVATGFKSDKGYSKVAKLPSTEVAELSRIFLPLFQDGNTSDKLAGAQHYVTGRASAGVSTIFSLLTNKDYFGNPVVAQNSDGKVDVGKTAQNLALSKGPIPIQQGIKAATGKESVGEAVVNTLGPRVVVDPTDPQYKAVSDYFKGRDKFVQNLNPNEQALFNKINPVKKDTNGQSILDKNSYTTPSNYEDLLANPQFASKYQSYQQSQQSHDPLWDLPQDQLRAYMQATIISKNDPGGDSATTRQLYAKVPQTFFDARSAYFDNLKASGVDLGASTTSQKPKMPQELVDFSNSYQNLPYGTGARSAALRSPQGQAYIAYLDQNKVYNNQERADLGLPSLPDESSKYSSYGKKKVTVSPGTPKAFVSKISSGSALKAPKVKLAKGKGAKVAIAKSGKASVKLKRSKV